MQFPGIPADGVQIRWLAELPERVAELAAIHHDEWSALMPDWSLLDAQAELADHATRRTFPTTLVAMHGDELIGSVSLVAQDAAQFTDHTPWLCSFWVHPQWRGRGIGGDLLTRVCFAARRWGFVHVWLFTDGITRLYERFGFVHEEVRPLFTRTVKLLRLTL